MYNLEIRKCRGLTGRLIAVSKYVKSSEGRCLCGSFVAQSQDNHYVWNNLSGLIIGFWFLVHCYAAWREGSEGG
jgi:hypothetical protein